MKEINSELLNPADLWEIHAGMIDELEAAGRNRLLLSDTYGEKSEIAQAAVAIEASIRALRTAILQQFKEYVESGQTDAAIDAVEAAAAEKLEEVSK